ncbi:IS66 family transposase [Stigmatella sp. ncwal1]|uniref:IS66 family transposase n=1 Tax=Stigmatella ashevillensis TaxID=2995309 RepID=A0ABT5DFX7_9BACT|nr:IS66 family transposase [Stigmatella ashevillena]MDC0712018.1 IS66 family transposase [Stigmatella ashevillena]
MSPFESIPAQVVQLQVLLGAALTRIRQLEQENAQLRERLRQNSTNSSRPPSSDAPGAARAKKKRKRRRRHPGGQPGPPKHERELVPSESVQRVVELMPERCQHCQRELKGKDAEPQRHQVVELDPVKALVTEYRSHQLKCAFCGMLTRAEVPREARSAFGERLGASMSLLVGKYRLSKRLVCEVLSDIVGVHVSVGSVSNLEQQMSAALKAPVEQAQEHVRNAAVVNADETGWAQGVKEGRAARAWLWVVASALVVVFRIATSRGSQVIKALLGEDFLGWLITDRWSAYGGYDAGLRQLCWSHLTRDFQGFIDRGGQGGRIGSKLMAERNRMFKWWHRVRDGTLERRMFQQRMSKVERKVGELLRQAQACGEKKTAGIARQILRLEKCLWVFVDVPGVEPTNNYGERTIRQGVIYRKISFGTRSERGSRFIERILTVVTTLKQQKRNPLEFLTAALGAYRRGLPPPSLLPGSASAQAASGAA